ncbi:MAG TPA: LodA/GoxA family CTQ-dependent oxidase [Kofleriaceae bacterium]|nr:LodA/GoxA family CTQ-dependent oxidase [Kofleriaceae bacterium]
MSKKTVFRVHPTINFARLGTSEEYYLSPETCAGMPVEGSATTGGLPIKPGTESEVIHAKDLRDADGNLKRQAARFRLFGYELDGEDRYPCPAAAQEIVRGSRLADGRVVRDIVWTVHVANKKAAAFAVVPLVGIDAYADGQLPQLRNPQVYGDVNTQRRLASLVIDPGPRALAASSGGTVRFDARTTPSYGQDGQICELKNYQTYFPSPNLYFPAGKLDSLGEMRTDDKGRLLVLAAYGRTAAQYDEYGDPVPLTADLNNANWFDDAADGSVSATLVFDDGSSEPAFGAWVVCCDPAYAPQIRNVVSIWDDVYDMWIRELGLQPEVFDAARGFNPDYQPAFETLIRPVFRASLLQRWTVNLPPMAVRAHEAVDAITAADDPDRTIMAGLNFIRNPNRSGEDNIGVPLMPLSVGDAGKSFLSVSKTQYFFLEQWSRHKHVAGHGPALGRGEQLDMASLTNCLGGRYVPGIEMSYVVRCADIYDQDWRQTGAGPFRVKPRPLAYAAAKLNMPVLTGGWLPLKHMTDGLEPGDLSKFMAVPWQTDYNSCSIHQPSINTGGQNLTNGNATTLYWSWPSQRPDAVYVADEVVHNVLPRQQWAIRGKDSYALDPKSASTFQKALHAVRHWHRLGIVVQGTVIGKDYAPDYYLEVQNKFDDSQIADDPVLRWPFNTNPPSGETI